MDVASRAQIDAETILERHWTDRLSVDSVAVAVAMGIDSYWMTIGVEKSSSLSGVLAPACEASMVRKDLSGRKAGAR